MKQAQMMIWSWISRAHVTGHEPPHAGITGSSHKYPIICIFATDAHTKLNFLDGEPD